MTKPSCSRRLLAKHPIAQLEACTCGSVHLVLGPLTLRLTPDAVGVLADLFESARRALGHATDTARAAAVASAPPVPSAASSSRVGAPLAAPFQRPAHRTQGRRLLSRIEEWEVRGGGARVYGGRVSEHLQFFNAARGVSLLTPSNLTRGCFEVLLPDGVCCAHRDYAQLRGVVLGEHAVLLPSADDLVRAMREHLSTRPPDGAISRPN